MKLLFGLILSLIGISAQAATCQLTEFDRLPIDPSGKVVYVGAMPPTPTPQLIIFTTSLQSSALSSTTNFIRIQCDSATNIKVGSNPTATSVDYRIPAGGVDWIFITTRGSKVAFYDGSS